MIVMTGSLLVKIPTAQSSDFDTANSVLNSSKAADEIVDRQSLEEGQVFVVQTRSKGVEIIEAGRVMTTTRNFLVTIEDENGKILRVFYRLGRGSDLIATARMQKEEAIQLLKSGGVIVEEL
ncbi:hypothetical protein BCD64_03570 [Nostoc sp. MBR 210]|uniref:Uncharacterized protein n=2 Tax=Nostoc TaxID=1177 RepID=A0ABR8G180_9NOSO|nr:hypothetical protein [Nostoc spongiaeforme FACHB-130]OCQ88836.1 hypothetical protein BCD64_03570 [Nostoc sp. MBR 210]